MVGVLTYTNFVLPASCSLSQNVSKYLKCKMQGELHPSTSWSGY